MGSASCWSVDRSMGAPFLAANLPCLSGTWKSLGSVWKQQLSYSEKSVKDIWGIVDLLDRPGPAWDCHPIGQGTLSTQAAHAGHRLLPRQKVHVSFVGSLLSDLMNGLLPWQQLAFAHSCRCAQDHSQRPKAGIWACLVKQCSNCMSPGQLGRPHLTTRYEIDHEAPQGLRTSWLMARHCCDLFCARFFGSHQLFLVAGQFEDCWLWDGKSS